MQRQAPVIGRFVRQLMAEGGSRTQLIIAYVDVARQLLSAFNGDSTGCCVAAELLTVDILQAAPVITSPILVSHTEYIVMAL